MTVFASYLPGSFRDVPFLYVDSDGEIGRRVAVFEYPGRDIPLVEDMGKKARVWSLELVVAGQNYMVGRNDLINALSEKGPGTLVHPTLGELTVSVLSARGPVESTREGGTARFSVTFIESGAQTYPLHAVDFRAMTADAGDVVDQAAGQQLTDAVDVSGQDFTLTDAVAQVTEFVDTVKAKIAKISEIVSNSDIMKAINDISASASDLIRAPMDLYMGIQDIFNDIVTAVTNPLDAFNALRDFFDFAGTPDSIPLTTSARITQAENKTQIAYAMTVAASVSAAKAASLAEYASQGDADTVRGILADQMDTLTLTAGSQLFEALMDLRAAIMEDLATRPGLPGIRAVTLQEDTPALVLAYQLYADADRADEIVLRNAISHPGFISGGLALEVLDV
jgi:prophage DNA circulation protein